MENKSQAHTQVEVITAKLDNYQIGRVEILQIPPYVLTRTRITPDMLEKQFDYKLTIRDMRGGAYRDGLLEAMKSVVVQPESEMADIRWGIIFYGLEDRRLGAIYFDKWGGHGAVGNVPVSFKGKLFKWLDSNFSCCFH